MMDQASKFSTFFLFKKTNPFLKGMSTVFNIYGDGNFKYNTSKTDVEADMKALINDWGVVNHDLILTINKLMTKERELQSKQLTLNF